MRIYRRMMCLVLVALLMTSSVFAMTVETAEAKKAIVETRVKKELLTGQVTSSEDVIRIALEHCDAPIAKDGMTACIDEDGRIQVTQVLNESAVKAGSTTRELAVTQLVVVDSKGVEATNAIYNGYLTGSGGSNEYSIYATQTGYYSYDVGFSTLLIKVRYMSTTLTYGTAMKAKQLQQRYVAVSNAVSADASQYSAVVSSPSAGTAYSFTPSSPKWYNPVTGNPGGYIGTEAIITTVGTSGFTVRTRLYFDDALNKYPVG